MDQTLYLHIGLPKTGTTSLQFVMNANKSALLERGLLYPKTMRHPLKTATQHRFLNELIRQQRDRFDRGAKVAPGMFERIAEEIRESGAPMALMSEELFSYDPTFIGRVLGQFQEHLETKVIVHLRRQDIWSESMYAQSIRGGYQAPFDSFIKARATTERMEYDTFLAVWVEIFGKERIIPRLYRERQTKSHIDVLEYLGIDIEGLDFGQDRNPSMNMESITFMRGMKNLSKPHYPKFNQIFANTLISLTEKGRPTFLSPADRTAYLDSFAAGNEAVRAEWFADEPVLFPYEESTAPAYDPSSETLDSARRSDLLRGLVASQDMTPTTTGQSDTDVVQLEQQLDAICAESKAAV